jgi:8-oxo-dGTP diphosphatase
MDDQSGAYLEPQGRLRPSDAAVALIVDAGGRYLVQLRDAKPTIFFPDHWGCFGGALDPGETHEEALVRELHEELALDVTAHELCLFTTFTIDFGFAGGPVVSRTYFELRVANDLIGRLTLGEGRAMGLFAGSELLTKNMVPYDRFAVWMHCYRDKLAG